mgnify:CR=1 FL=1
MRIGVISTGSMGTTIGHLCQQNGHEVCWASEGRSENSCQNALSMGFTDLKSRDLLVDGVDVVFCVVSGDGNALDVAQFCVDKHFSGIFVDGNTLADEKTEQFLLDIAKPLKFVSLAIRGWTVFDGDWAKPEQAQMFLSGEYAGLVASLLVNPSWSLTLNPSRSPKGIIRELLHRDKQKYANN